MNTRMIIFNTISYIYLNSLTILFHGGNLLFFVHTRQITKRFLVYPKSEIYQQIIHRKYIFVEQEALYENC